MLNCAVRYVSAAQPSTDPGMTRILATIALGVLLGASAFTANAQTPNPRGVASQCAYRSCAVRVEPVFLGEVLVVGANTDASTRLGGWGGGVGVLLAGPDSAATYARSYVVATRRSTVLGLLAAASYAIVIARTDNFSNDFHGGDAALAIAGAGFAIATIPFVMQSRRNLSRSVWWYNSALSP